MRWNRGIETGYVGARQDGRVIVCSPCGAVVPDEQGPQHSYVPAVPGCWRIFGEVQADEMTRFGYPAEHRLVVDAYMAQHPGDGLDRRDRQSVAVHLVGLCAILEVGMTADQAMLQLRRVIAPRTEFPLLGKRNDRGSLTITDMLGVVDLDDYAGRARAWGESVWLSWAHEHERIRTWMTP